MARRARLLSLLPAALAAAALGSAIRADAPPPYPTEPFERLARWVSLVETHEPGERDRAADETSTLHGAGLGEILGELQQARGLLDEARTSRRGPTATVRDRNGQPVAVADIARVFRLPAADLQAFLGDMSPAGRRGVDLGIARLLERGALLHGDVAMVVPPAVQLVSTDAVEPRRSLRVQDGRAELLEGAGNSHIMLHLRFGSRLVDLAALRSGQLDAGRAWYHGTAAFLFRFEMYGDALLHLEDARRALVDDPVVLFYSGVLHEIFALPRTQSVVQSLDLPPGMAHDLGGLVDELRRAEAFFRRALEADRTYALAAVHHGRVLNLLGSHAAARAVLARARPDATDRPTRYFAALFLGDACRGLGEAAEARVHYARAGALYPHAQAPGLALGVLARTHGDRESAVAALRQALDRPRSTSLDADPWWTYATAHVADADLRIETMRRVLAEGAGR